MAGAWGLGQRLGAAALVTLSLGAALLHALTSDSVPFLVHDPGAPWVVAPRPVVADLEQWGRVDPPITAFERVLALERIPPRVLLRLRALGRFEVLLNGDPVPGGSSDGSDWRAWCELELAPHLVPGSNSLRVRVRNARGPAALALEVRGLPEPVVADGSFVASRDGRVAGPAVVADDTRANPTSFGVETPAEALAERGGPLLLLALAGAGALLALGRLSEAARVSLPRAAFALAVLAWVALFVRWARLPSTLGFDVAHHRAYVDFLREHGRLPLATDGWSMYHPPLFYALQALVAPLGERALDVLPWLAGLGSVFVARALASRLFPGDFAVQSLSVLFAATLPMGLYPAAYFSNEALHAFLVGVALLVAVDALLAERVGPARMLAVGAAFGVAALTKFTALVVAPVAFFFLAVKLAAVERNTAGRALALALLPCASLAVVCGWFYLRNWLALGTPLVGNWNLPGPDQIWWQQPGFHTPAYYAAFGEALRHPYLAGFHSFWDGLYSTLWGDGGIGGRVVASQRHGFFDWSYVSAGFALALPLSALGLVGGGVLLAQAFRSGDPRRRAALSFLLTALYAVGFSIGWLTLELPFFAQAKAFYGLGVAPILVVCLAVGTARSVAWLGARPGGAALRLVIAGAVASGCGAFYLGYLG